MFVREIEKGKLLKLELCGIKLFSKNLILIHLCNKGIYFVSQV